MDNLFSKPPVLVSYRQIYEQNISEKLKAIDVFLKATDCPYNVQHIAELLGMPIGEVLEIMAVHNIQEVNKLDFFTIVASSSSFICRLISRQWKHVGTTQYDASVVAYIYELNPNKVQKAFDTLGKEYILESELKTLFDYISVPIFRM